MHEKITIYKATFMGIFVFMGSIFDIISSGLLFFVLLMFIDYISGMLASKKEAMEHPKSRKYGWNSKKGIMGIYKKVGYICTVFVAICTDYVIFKLLREVNINYRPKSLFSLLVLIWFILNEMLSILENVGRMGFKLPNFLVNVITELKNNIDDEGST